MSRRFWPPYLQVRIGSVARVVEGQPIWHSISEGGAAIRVMRPTFHAVKIPWLRVTLGHWFSPWAYGLHVEASPAKSLEIGCETHTWRWRWVWFTAIDVADRRGVWRVLDTRRILNQGMGIIAKRITG